MPPTDSQTDNPEHGMIVESNDIATENIEKPYALAPLNSN